MARIINFVDGASSSTTPTLGDLVASNLIVYANDAAYEAAEAGSPAIGNIYYNSTDNEVRYYDGTQWQVLPTKAEDVIYDNSTSLLTATDVQAAIDEVEGRVDANETNISDNATDILNLETLSGSPGDTDHGTFTGTTIPDNSDTKESLQALETEVETKIPSTEKGSANGVASLDGTGRIPSAQLPTTALEYKGSYDASGGGSGSPSLTDGSGNTGDFYRVSAAGTVDHGAGNVTYAVGDSVIYNGSTWDKYDEQSIADTDALPEGSTNLYYTETRVSANTDVSTNTAKISADGSVNTHSDVDDTTKTAADGDILEWDNSTMKWERAANSAGSSNLSVRTESTAYTAVTSDDLILVDSSGGAFTVDLPTASGNTGKVFTIKKISSDFNAVTIDPNSTETIDGSTTTTVNTDGEVLKFASDGTNWEIIDRETDSEWESFTPTITWTTNSTHTGHKRRVGDSLQIEIRTSLSGAPNAATYEVTIPNSLTIDTTNKSTLGGKVGTAYLEDNGTAANRRLAQMQLLNTTKVRPIAHAGSTITQAAPFTWANNDKLVLNFTVPIDGWKA